jgi:hypothetical protein
MPAVNRDVVRKFIGDHPVFAGEALRAAQGRKTLS